MMENFTKGKWELKGLKIVVSPNGIIALCPTPQQGGTFECSANARLIAAAPEMYEALKDLYNLRNHPDNYTMQETLDILERVEAVLASIEGGK
jgi:hypothetical protein